MTSLWLESISFCRCLQCLPKISTQISTSDTSLAWRIPKMPDLSSLSNQNCHEMVVNRPIVLIKSVRKCKLNPSGSPSNRHQIARWPLHWAGCRVARKAWRREKPAATLLRFMWKTPDSGAIFDGKHPGVCRWFMIHNDWYTVSNIYETRWYIYSTYSTAGDD